MSHSRTTSTAQVRRLETTESLGNRRADEDRDPSGDIHTRTCARCGRRAWFRIEEGGWARCSKCGRYA